MRKASLLAVAGLVTLTALPALAQRASQDTSQWPRDSYGSYRTQPGPYAPRAQAPYSYQPGTLRSRDSRSNPQWPRESYGSYRTQPGPNYVPRMPSPVSQPPGTIRWNTPNADGNLGGPTVGGTAVGG